MNAPAFVKNERGRSGLSKKILDRRGKHHETRHFATHTIREEPNKTIVGRDASSRRALTASARVILLSIYGDNAARKSYCDVECTIERRDEGIPPYACLG